MSTMKHALPAQGEASELPLRLAGVTDCHIHINDPRYAYCPDADLFPPPATVEHYLRVKAELGVDRIVVVQPSSYGTDNRCTLEAVARFGEAARAVVVVDPAWGIRRIAGLHQQGARGVRFNLLRPSPLVADAMERVASLIAPYGWHLQLHASPSTIAELGATLTRLPVQVVFDHLGRLRPEEAERHPAFEVMRSLLASGRAWVKLSGVELDGAMHVPRYETAAGLARRFIDLAPERVVWGSNWPHPATPPTQACADGIDDAALLRWLLACAPDPVQQRRILCTNPSKLYGFAPV